MSDLGDLLAAEAQRLEPARQPAFDLLLQRRQKRDRRNVTAAAAAAVMVLAVAAGSVLLRQRPAETPGTVGGVVVTGSLLLAGGPMGTPPSGVAGTLWFEAVDGTTTTATAAGDGRFRILVAPGRYAATGS